jgi:xylulose-5-phosphate/fructose-6-phosphate phosphoketolase
MNDPQFVFDPTVASAVPAGSVDASGTDTTGPLSADQLRRLHLIGWPRTISLSGRSFAGQSLPANRFAGAHQAPAARPQGTSGIELLYVHLNRVIVEQDVNMIYLAGPGDGPYRRQRISRGPH